MRSGGGEGGGGWNNLHELRSGLSSGSQAGSSTFVLKQAIVRQYIK